MKTKLLNLFALSILSLVLLMGFASATTSNNFTITDVNAPTSIDENAGPFTFTFNLTYTGTLGSETISFVDSTSSISSISIPTETGMDGTTNESRTVTGTISNFAGQAGNTINVIINATDTSSRDDQTTFLVLVTSDDPSEILTCDAVGNPGNLKVKDIDFNNDGMDGKEFGDDNEWFPLDDIEVEIEIENNGNEDVDDIEIEWGIYNIRTNEWVLDLDDEKDFNLKDGKDEILTVSFNIEDDFDVDLEDLTDGEDYRFYVIATGTVDDIGSPQTCVSNFEDAEIVLESDFVVLDNIDFPETLMCGDTVQITADVWNIGDNDQDDVSVDLVGKGLGLDKTILIGDIDAFDNDEFMLTFTIPNDAEEKTYTLNFEVWDEDNDVYENDFDEDESEFAVPFRVTGGCGVSAEDEVSVSASLQSGGQAGQDMVVRATITNNGDELKTFTVNAAGFGQWASSYTIDRTNLVLGAGNSVDVLFTFDVNRDASGSQSFTIELVSDDNQVTTQPVSVAIEGKSGLFGLTGLVTSGNAYLWGIGLLNIILVVIIIIVAVRVARR